VKLSRLAARILELYREGLFPMADEHGEIQIYTADPRGVLPLNEFHLPKRLERLMRKNPFEVRFDTVFGEVIRGCAAREDCWISPQIVTLYEELHRQGHAHCVETWQDGALVGGLYGLAIGGAFFGESMFRTVSEASKVCMVALVERLRQRNYALLDCQYLNHNTRRFGGREIPQTEYLGQLQRALRLTCQF
jgi:leucyl/phenylalanyl-tRNA--protein transferase